MFRTTDIVLIALMVAGAAFTYKTKHEVEGQHAELRRIEQRIRLEEDTITVLKADWSLLTQPARLQRLAESFQSELELEPVEARQIVGFDDIPTRPVEIEDFSDRRLGGIAEGGADGIQTGGIVQ